MLDISTATINEPIKITGCNPLYITNTSQSDTIITSNFTASARKAVRKTPLAEYPLCLDNIAAYATPATTLTATPKKPDIAASIPQYKLLPMTTISAKYTCHRVTIFNGLFFIKNIYYNQHRPYKKLGDSTLTTLPSQCKRVLSLFIIYMI